MKKILAFFLMIFLIGCAKISNEKFTEILINNGNNPIKINAEIADDNNERAKGLMSRETLDENAGMLFVFEGENHQSFWMKNTLIPLDMIFINEKLEIVDIKYAVPCKEDPCAVYRSEKPAKYVLEVNGNFTKRNRIIEGNKIEISPN